MKTLAAALLLLLAIAPSSQAEQTCRAGEACTPQNVGARKEALEAEFRAIPDLREIIRPFTGDLAMRKEFAPTSPLQGYSFDWRVFEELRWERWIGYTSVKALSWRERRASAVAEVSLQAYYPSDLFLITTNLAGERTEEFYTLHGLLRITHRPGVDRAPLTAEVRTDKRPLPDSSRFGLRTLRPLTDIQGAASEEETLKLCRYAETIPTKTHLGTGSGDMRLYRCEEVQEQRFADGRTEQLWRRSEIGYFPGYNLFLEVASDGDAAPRRIIEIDAVAPKDLADWHRLGDTVPKSQP